MFQSFIRNRWALALPAALVAATAQAALVNVTITIENLAATNGISFAPLHYGFNQGVFDSFDINSAATAPIISIAEGGSGSAWQPAFASAEPTATRGTIGGALLPGNTASMTVTVNTLLNQYFTFASMVIPSNDHFIGNDAPTEYRLFDAVGNLLLSSITQSASDIWDAGSETFDPLAAAFLQIGNNDLRTPQNSTVGFNFSDLAGYNGLTTAAGYVFNSGLTDSTDVYRISFNATTVPEPQTLGLVLSGLALSGWFSRRRRQSAQANTTA